MADPKYGLESPTYKPTNRTSPFANVAAWRKHPLINPRGLTTLAPGIVGGIAFAVVYGSLASTGGDPINRFLGIKEGGGH